MTSRVQKSYLLSLPAPPELTSDRRKSPVSQKRLLVLTAFSELNVATMRMLLGIRSSLILDFRAYPRFDIDTFSRRKAFDIMKRHDVRYYDVAGLLGASTDYDAILNPAIIAQKVRQFAEEDARSVVILFFADASSLDYSGMILNVIKTNSKSSWSHCIVGHSSKEFQAVS